MTEKTPEFDVVEISIGDKVKGDFIVFKSRGDLISAMKEIDNGRDIFVMEPDGTGTLLLNRVLNPMVYDMRVKLSFRESTKGDEEKC